jgi:hypothetical protein
VDSYRASNPFKKKLGSYSSSVLSKQFKSPVKYKLQDSS